MQITSNHKRNDNCIEDYVDSIMATQHPLLVTTEELSIHLMMYFDELEVCNPLGSARKKHKLGNIVLLHGNPTVYFIVCFLGMFYFTIGNIHPKHRSRLTSIYLLAICKATIIKEYGIGTILNQIVNDVCILEQVSKLIMNVLIGVKTNTHKCTLTMVNFKINITLHTVGSTNANV